MTNREKRKAETLKTSDLFCDYAYDAMADDGTYWDYNECLEACKLVLHHIAKSDRYQSTESLKQNIEKALMGYLDESTFSENLTGYPFEL